MLCKEIMTSELVMVAPDDTIAVAGRMMRDANIGFLPVCNEDRLVVGTVTDRDLAIRAVASGRPAETPVGEIMSQDVVSCRPTDELEVAERLMRIRRKARMLCTDGELHLYGIISLSDIAQHETAKAVGELLRRITDRETSTFLDVDLDDA